MPAVYITLNTTLATRGAVAQQRFAKLGCMPEQLVVSRHPLGSMVGIFRSHVLALRHFASLPPAELYMVFEDDAIRTMYYSESEMQTVVDELRGLKEFDIAYMASIQKWPFMVWYSPPWWRATPHTINHAWSTMHGIIYSQQGLHNVLPLLEARLEQLETDSVTQAECLGEHSQCHVDLYLERTRSLRRLQVVPYMFDQDWTEATTNDGACAEVGCDSATWSDEHAYLRNHDNQRWSKLAYDVGAHPGLFYFALILAVVIGGLITYYCCYKARRFCFRESAPRRRQGGASEKTPLKLSR